MRISVVLFLVAWAALTTVEGQEVNRSTGGQPVNRLTGQKVQSAKWSKWSKMVTKRPLGHGRSQGGGYVGGGGGNYLYHNGGHLMYFSNFDTALTTLAFLSFGVFLLNMLMSFFDLGPGPGDEINRKWHRKRRHLDPRPLTPVHWVLASALHQQLTHRGDPGDLSALCHLAGHAHPGVRGHLTSVLDSMLRLSSIGNGEQSGNHTVIKTEVGRMAAILENGDCHAPRPPLAEKEHVT